MSMPDAIPFMITVCSADGIILHADPRLPTDDFKLGHVLPDISHRLPLGPGEYAFARTKSGLLEFFRVETEYFKGYVGVLCNERYQDSIISQLEGINKELEAIFESSHDGIVVADENGWFIVK